MKEVVTMERDGVMKKGGGGGNVVRALGVEGQRGWGAGGPCSMPYIASSQSAMQPEARRP